MRQTPGISGDDANPGTRREAPFRRAKEMDALSRSRVLQVLPARPPSQVGDVHPPANVHHLLVCSRQLGIGLGTRAATIGCPEPPADFTRPNYRPPGLTALAPAMLPLFRCPSSSVLQPRPAAVSSLLYVMGAEPGLYALGSPCKAWHRLPDRHSRASADSVQPRGVASAPRLYRRECRTPRSRFRQQAAQFSPV